LNLYLFFHIKPTKNAGQHPTYDTIRQSDFIAQDGHHNTLNAVRQKKSAMHFAWLKGHSFMSAATLSLCGAIYSQAAAEL
jgi:hypothetical protein